MKLNVMGDGKTDPGGRCFGSSPIHQGDDVLDPRGTMFWVQGDGVLDPGGRCFGYTWSIGLDMFCQIVRVTGIFQR